MYQARIIPGPATCQAPPAPAPAALAGREVHAGSYTVFFSVLVFFSWLCKIHKALNLSLPGKRTPSQGEAVQM